MFCNISQKEIIEGEQLIGEFDRHMKENDIKPGPVDNTGRKHIGSLHGRNVYRIDPNKIKKIRFPGDEQTHYYMDNSIVARPGWYCLGIERDAHNILNNSYVSQIEPAHELAVNALSSHLETQMFNSFGMSPLLTMPSAGWATWDMGGETGTTTSRDITSKPSSGLAKCSKFLWEK